MKTVLLDCDGVMADFVASYLALLNREGGTNYVHHDVTDWDIVDCLKIPKDVEKRANAQITYDFCANIMPIPGAPEGVKELAKVADVYIITSPWSSCPGWTHAREKWLRHYCDITHDRVLHGSAKHLLNGDIFVDDKASTVLKWQAAHPTKLSVMWDQPWNKHSKLHQTRMGHWSQLIEEATNGRR